jgi:type VI secretion system protein ImpL
MKRTPAPSLPTPNSLQPLARGLLSLVGLVAAATLVWFVGPLLTMAGRTPLAGERERWTAIGVLVALAALQALWLALRAGRTNRRLIDRMVSEASAEQRAAHDTPDTAVPPGPGEQEVELLGQRFERAVGLLKHRRVGGRHPWLAARTGRPYVYELPWYVIIGAPGAGKTTALVNSGLEFPLAAQLGKKAVRGIGGTRNCDWWFTNDAVLIDTAGRYTTHDSHRAADRTAWLGFLDLLAQYRPGRPINGVLLTLSVSDLLNASEPQRAAHARELRARIDELHQRLGIRFPIYAMVTKCDLLAGFMEFFADFDKDERAQVWGVTFPYDTELTSDDPLARLANDFAVLEKRLNQCLIDRLHAQHDRERRPAIYAFPQQWSVLRETLQAFLQGVFGEAQEDRTPPFLRGVYFTSATQEGTPVDRALGGVARAMGLTSRLLAPARPSGKSFFVTRLLRDVVFTEAGLAGTNLRWQRRRVGLGWAAVAASVCLVGSGAALTWAGFQHSHAQIASLDDEVAALGRQAAQAAKAAPTDLAALLPVLQTLQAVQRQAAVARGAGTVPMLSSALGFDQGSMLAAAAHDGYERLLKDAFVPRIAARLEARLRASSDDPAAQESRVSRLYEDLKAYLMLFGGRHFDAAALRAFLLADWEGSTPPVAASAAEREALRGHLERLLARGEVGAPSQAQPQVVARARELVAGVPLAQRAYGRLRQMDPGPQAVTFSVESAGGAGARRVFTRASGKPLDAGVPGLYTRAVLQQSLRPRTVDVLRQLAAEQSWVLGTTHGAAADPAGQAAVADEVERLYLADYKRLWGEFVADLRLAPTSDLAATAEAAQLLAHADSPLATLLRNVVREVSVAPPAQLGASGTSTTAAAETLVDPSFEALRAFVAGPPSQVDEMQALLGRLSQHLSAVDDATRRKTVLPASNVTRELAQAAQRAPEPLRGMLIDLAHSSAGQAFAAMREPLARQMAGELAGPCSRAMSGRYPFVRTSREDMSREEFMRTFAAGGVVDGFFQRHLFPYLDTSIRPWAYRKPDGARAESSDALLQFQRAQAIREAFFREGGRTFGVQLDFRLIELDADAAAFSLDVDGQVMRFVRGATGRRGAEGAVQSVRWPGAGPSGRVQVQLTPHGGSAGPGHVFEGPWALLRLFDRVRLEPGATPDRVIASFDVEGRKARFEIRSSTPHNPLLRSELEQFQCPRRL